MNFRVDVIIIGDSTTGHEILDKIATGNKNIKVAFLSKAFKSTTTHDYLNVQYFRDEVEYVSYRHRLFCCYMKNGDNIFSTHLVVASGLNYEPLVINGEQVPCVFNNVDDAPKIAKEQPAVVICNNDTDVKFALDVAKKYKQAYICTRELDVANITTAATAKKLAKVENIAVLPNASINKATAKNGALQKVELDNYSEITCSAIYVKTASTPAIEFIPRKIVARVDGYPDVNDRCESVLVPNCYIAGSCLKKYTKPMEQRIVEAIIKDF
jgi:thioredoxin reductase